MYGILRRTRREAQVLFLCLSLRTFALRENNLPLFSFIEIDATAHGSGRDAVVRAGMSRVLALLLGVAVGPRCAQGSSLSGSLVQAGRDTGDAARHVLPVTDSDAGWLRPADRPSCPLTRPLIHLHLSKTGGSRLCKTVNAQACRTHGFNCALRRHMQDGPWWVPHSEKLSAWHTANFAYPPRGHAKNRTCAFRRKAGSQFFNVESPLFGPLCEGFDHSAILREPLARAQSQARELNRWGLLRKAKCANYSEWQRVAPALFDNYYVRMIDGEETFVLPHGAIGRAHAQRAARTLSEFSLITTLPNATDAFARTFGLRMSTPKRKPKRTPRCELNVEDRRGFLAQNRWDAALYAQIVGTSWRVKNNRGEYEVGD